MVLWDYGIMGLWDYKIMGLWDYGIMGVSRFCFGRKAILRDYGTIPSLF